MTHQSIIQAVENSIDVLCNTFHSHPTPFFTENDLICYFYSILQQQLPISKTPDKDGYEHFLIHREYPTPFRCDMRKNKFELKDDDARTEKGRKYQRGHYDIVVLNPDFISQHSCEVIEAQNYGLYRDRVLSKIDRCNPIILYGIEFMYSKVKEKGVDKFVAKVIQDADKLLASNQKYRGFMAQVKMLTFVKGSSKEICSLLTEKLSRRNEIILCFGD